MRAALLASTLIILMSDSYAFSPAPSPEPQSVVPQVDDGRMAVFAGLLSEGKSLSDRGYYYEACVAFNGVLERGEATENYYKEAEYYMAVNLHKLGLIYSSFVYFSQIMDSGETHPYYMATLPWILRIGQDVPGFTSAREYLSRFDSASYPEELRDDISWIVGDYFYSIDEFDAAVETLAMVLPPSDPAKAETYLKARLLTGITHARAAKKLAPKGDITKASIEQLKPSRERYSMAVEAFKDILKYAAQSNIDSPFIQSMKSKAIMGMARVFYSVGEYSTAVKYYEQIERYSPNWLQALFEKSWAYFQLGDFEKAMGNLHTLNSPYFEEQFFPESHVLQAVILFTNCQYDEAIAVVDRFVNDYDELRKELNEQLAEKKDPADFYYWLSSLGQKGSSFSPKLKKIFNIGLSDRKLYRLFTFIVALQREEQLLESMRQTAVQKDLAERLLGDLVMYRGLAIGEVGQQARDRLEAKRRELATLLTQAMKVKFEALNALKEEIEGKRKTALDSGESRGWKIPGEESQYLAWPFDGEYWKDELDSYLFRVENVCPTASPQPEN